MMRGKCETPGGGDYFRCPEVGCSSILGNNIRGEMPILSSNYLADNRNKVPLFPLRVKRECFSFPDQLNTWDLIGAVGQLR